MSSKHDYSIKNQYGMVSVEVILSLVIFSVAILGMVNFMNVYMVHNRVQYAINCAANEIASYSYVYSALGIREAEKRIQGDFGDAASMDDRAVMSVVDSYNKMNTLIGGVNNTIDDIQNVELSTDYFNTLNNDFETLQNNGQATMESLQTTRDNVTQCFEDPKGTLAGFIYLAASGGITAGKSFIGEALARTLTKPYLSLGSRDADDYLRAYGVEGGYAGLNFGGTSIFCGEQKNMIDIEVRYDVRVNFLGLIMADPVIHVVQRVSVPAWLSGDDQKVSELIGE